MSLSHSIADSAGGLISPAPKSSTDFSGRRASAAAHWHGFTQMAEPAGPVIASARGCVLTTVDGRDLIDGVSSLWCNLHGHRHPAIDAAVIEQLGRVAHVTTLGMAADVTEELAARLAQITPGNLSHTFFSSDGSSAVEAAVKMAFQYWRQTQPASNRHRFLALGRAYHGDTTGSVSLGGIDHFHKLFGPILFDPIRGPVPCSYRHSAEANDLTNHYAAIYEDLIRRHADELVAVVMEPLVQGAAGMITHPPGLLRRIREACDRHDVLLIVDEVATGFGRTGRLFACEHESVTPDILCMGKGITGGYLPMAATIATPKVFDAFLGSAPENRQFFHGHTYGGNPLAAAAAIASIDLLTAPGMIDQINTTADRLRSAIEPVRNHRHVGDIRGRGMMIGIELVADQTTRQPFDPTLQVGRRVCDRLLDHGVWLRPLGDVVIVMPPLAISDAQIAQIGTALRHAIQTEVPRCCDAST